MPPVAPYCAQNKNWMQKISKVHPIANVFDKKLAFDELKMAFNLFA